MDFFVGQIITKPNSTQFSQWYVSNFQELKLLFMRSCEIVQNWDTSVPRLKYNLGAFPGMMQKMKAYFNQLLKKLNFEDFILGLPNQQRELSPRNSNNAKLDPSMIYFENINMLRDTVVQQPTNYDYNSGSFSTLFTMEESVSPQVFKRNVESDTVSIGIHKLNEKGQGIRFLYILINDLVVFATKVNDAGVPEKTYFEFVMSEKILHVVFRLRNEKGFDEAKQGRLLSVDNFEGVVELKRFRTDVIEKIKVPLRTTLLDGNIDNLNQVDLEISILLSYVRSIKLEDFESTIEDEIKFMHVENYWSAKKKWHLANFAEQNSLVSIENYEKIKQEFMASFPDNEFCFATFDKFVEQNYDLVPLAKSMFLSIFYADSSISDKLNLLWESMIFFEKLHHEYYISDECVESDTIQYFTRVICSGAYISMPEYAADNLVDYIFYGRIPTVRRALYITPIVDFFHVENLRRDERFEVCAEPDALHDRSERVKLHQKRSYPEACSDNYQIIRKPADRERRRTIHLDQHEPGTAALPRADNRDQLEQHHRTGHGAAEEAAAGRERAIARDERALRCAAASVRHVLAHLPNEGLLPESRPVQRQLLCLPQPRVLLGVRDHQQPALDGPE